MIKILKPFILLTLALFTISLMAQSSLHKLPIKNIGNEAYYYYKVGGNEDLNKIAGKLGITTQDITCYNPSAMHGVAKKQLLFFPVKAFKGNGNTHTQVAIKQQKVTHMVKTGETLYGIAKLYDIAIDALTQANPAAYAGVQPGDMLTIPQGHYISQESHSTDGESCIYHTIQQGETLYGVSKQYNTTIENLLLLNPGIYPNNFIEGEVIKVSPNTAQNIMVNRNITQFYAYEVLEGDSYESVARANNMPVAKLKEANPKIKKLKKGKVIYIPKEGSTVTQINSSRATEKELEQTYASKMEQVYNDVHKVKKDNEINIAIVLPFQLHKSNAPRQAYLYTDFYKGFLLAVDSVGNRAGKKVNVNVFDTEHNLHVTDSILALKQMKKMDLIFAPGEPKQLQRCINFGREHGIAVANCFSSKNEDYRTVPNVLQMVMPTSHMIGIVNNWLNSQFKDYTIIFLEDAESGDQETSNSIKDFLKSKKSKFQSISVVNNLDYNTITQRLDPGSNYLFVPTSGSKTFLKKIAGAIKQAKQERYDCEIAMLGQPEFLTYSKEFKSTFQAIDTYVYSRFFVANEKRGKSIERKFAKNYRESMIATSPSMGLLGFDMGIFAINSLGNGVEINSQTPYYDGVQMDISLKRASNWGGLVNQCVELIHFNNHNVSESIIK